MKKQRIEYTEVYIVETDEDLSDIINDPDAVLQYMTTGNLYNSYAEVFDE